MYVLARSLAIFCVLIFAINSVHPLKCYLCVGNTLAACEKNQTVFDCKPGLSCGTIGVQFATNGVPSITTFVKACYPSSGSCSSFFNQTGAITVHTCNMTRCSTNFCNGPPPTTAVPATSGVTQTKGTHVVSTKAAESPSSAAEKLCHLVPLYLMAVLVIAWSIGV